MSVVRQMRDDCTTYPVEPLFEFYSVYRPEAFLDYLLSEAQPSENTVSDSEPGDHPLFVVFNRFWVWSCLSRRNLRQYQPRSLTFDLLLLQG